MQPSPISLLIKREFVIFERVPMTQPGFELKKLSHRSQTPYHLIHSSFLVIEGSFGRL